METDFSKPKSHNEVEMNKIQFLESPHGHSIRRDGFCFINSVLGYSNCSNESVLLSECIFTHLSNFLIEVNLFVI